MITKQTAFDICCAYREIEASEKLLEEISEVIRRHGVPELRDVFGRQYGFQLGVPSGPTSHRLFDLAPGLALPVIEAHLAQKRSELSLLNEKAKTEL